MAGDVPWAVVPDNLPSILGSLATCRIDTSTYAGILGDKLTQTVCMPRRFAVLKFAKLSSTMMQRCGSNRCLRIKRWKPRRSGFG